ncbi:MAG TPA: bifunctional phosphoribosyl-AMP cyclohydrolase/phosphoribosyl-ATP diphosphatase HisIE [Acidobacteriota bacterium]|nr:bifunctional phosphoribosyl-AMP cyclohydrolase/phosphoribosyl-ATP diphosphatase HisIE [Acidobacteriota bacterium]
MTILEQLDWEKGNGLLPAIVQDVETGRVLMLGYMNRQALEHTLNSGEVTFWSRSREALWTKGETSGNKLTLEGVYPDCDNDTLLVVVRPLGPTCHRGTLSCFSETSKGLSRLEFLGELQQLIRKRRAELPEGSYTTRLFHAGVEEIAKKVGEEGVEVALSAFQSPQRSLEESADLIYHLLVLLVARDLTFQDVIAELESRHF